MRKFFIIIISIVFTGLALIAGLSLAFVYSPPSREAVPVVYEVKPGPFIRIAEDLFQSGLITNPSKFVWLARLTGSLKKVRVGEYELNTGMLPHEVLEVLMSGKSKLHTITFPEGINRFEIAEMIQKNGLGSAATFLQLTVDKQFITEATGDPNLTSLEGYLFPETYSFTKNTGERLIAKTMVETFHQNFNEISKGLRTPMELSRHQIVILASMIEKETGAPQERPMISGVFFNRLNKKMKLQSDPTTIYGIWNDTGKPVGNITREHLLTPNKYNTYTVPSLPFGPIANAGKHALQAVFQPATHEFIFFVSRNDGTHIFSKTLADHNNAVNRFQKDPKAREGKSWRDLNSKDKK